MRSIVEEESIALATYWMWWKGRGVVEDGHGFRPLPLEEHCCQLSFGKRLLSIQWAQRWIVEKYLSLDTIKYIYSQLKCESILGEVQMLLVAVWTNQREESEGGQVALQGGLQNNTCSINRHSAFSTPSKCETQIKIFCSITFWWLGLERVAKFQH